MAIIVSAEYFGGAITSTRSKEDITAAQMAHLFDCSINQLHRYESGKDLIPRDVLKHIIKYAVKMDAMLNNE